MHVQVIAVWNNIIMKDMENKMTRNIDEAVANALNYGRTLKTCRDEVKDNAVFLNGHKIFWIENGEKYFSLCGYNTTTTRNRLRVLGVTITGTIDRVDGYGGFRKEGTPYYKDKEIDKYETYKVED